MYLHYHIYFRKISFAYHPNLGMNRSSKTTKIHWVYLDSMTTFVHVTCKHYYLCGSVRRGCNIWGVRVINNVGASRYLNVCAGETRGVMNLRSVLCRCWERKLPWRGDHHSLQGSCAEDKEVSQCTAGRLVSKRHPDGNKCGFFNG